MALTLSPTGVKALIEEEGEVLTAYQDSAGVWTIGVGVTSADVAFPGNTITKKKSRELLKREIERTEKGVAPLIKVPLSQAQWDAIVLMSYNIGVGAFAKSTLLKKLNKGDYLGAADEMLKWDKATVDGRKVVLPGLKKRRARERAMFLSGTDIQETDDAFESNIEPDHPKPSVRLSDPGVVGTATLLGAGGLETATSALEPFAAHSEYIRYVWIALGVLTVLFVLYKSRKED
jgi:lysozyme